MILLAVKFWFCYQKRLSREIIRLHGMEKIIQVKVDEITAYRNVIPCHAREKAARILTDGVDVATFTSSSTVKNLVDLLNGNLDALARTAIACIGPITAETARDAGLKVDVVSAEHTVSGLVEALKAYYTEGGSGNE